MKDSVKARQDLVNIIYVVSYIHNLLENTLTCASSLSYSF